MNFTHSNQTTVRIWDLPTRLFHWLLAVCVIGAIVTAKIGGLWMEWHVKLGITALCLIIFRLIWGLVGSRYARFSHFVKGPWGILSYLKAARAPNHATEAPGHNPIGGWSVMLMLGVIGAQAFTGLFATDDIMIQGPLYAYVSNHTAETLTGIHHLISKAVIALIIVHVLAIFVYAMRGKRLVPPMLTGDVSLKILPPNTPAARDDITIRLLALVLTLIIAALGIWLWDLGNALPTSF